MNLSDSTSSQSSVVSWLVLETTVQSITSPPHRRTWNVLQPLRTWLNRLDVRNPGLAHRLCRLIPAQCPFEREVKLFDQTLVRIPPLCKLNPLYEEVVDLRFRAMCYLADECGEDVSPYC